MSTSKPFVKHVPEGTLSTIVIDSGDGVIIETILLDGDGNAVGKPQRTFLNFGDTVRAHHSAITASLWADEMIAKMDGEVN